MTKPIKLAIQYLLLALALPLSVLYAADDETIARPNIVLFLVDDMGWQDTSVPFHTGITELNRRYHTPNMERLAKSGMKFTQAYACSVCSPTRVSLMTGLNAARHRVTNWTLRKNASNDRRHPTLAFPKWNVNGLSPQPGIERTVHAKALPAFLRDVGYRTIHVGKAHFGAIGTPGADPRNIGFDVNIGGHAAGGPGSFLGTQRFSAAWRKGARVWDVPGLEKYHGKEIFLTEALTIEANQAVDQAVEEGKPFFLYMSHYAVHVPFAEDNRFYQKYRDAGLGHTEAMYAAMVEGMDKSLGDILDNVERRGLSDNTIVLFMSDNGGLSAHGRGGKAHKHNKPLSSGKGSAHEGGIRVPMIAHWPGVTKAGSVCRQPVIIEDFFPTILEMAGLREIEQVGGVIDGRSFVSLLRGEKDDSWDERSLFWHFPNNWGPKGPGIGPSSTIRRGPWKLIYYYDTRRFELFLIAKDIEEEHNLADDYPDMREPLADQLRSYLQRVQAQFPIDKKSGKPVLIPGKVEMTKTDVFVSGTGGYHTYRIPAVIVTKRGSLLAFCEGRKTSRSDHGDLDLVLRRSTDNGKTWTPMQIVYEEGDDAKITIGNPCPVVDQQTGRIWLPFCRDNDDVLITFSDDDGKTWAKPRDITDSVKQPDWGWYATGPGVGIQLSQGKHKGRLVIPCDHRIKNDGKRITYSHAIYSDDHGETWKLGGTVDRHSNECQVVELRDGTLVMNMRNYWGRDGQQHEKDKMRAVALSRDGGETWEDLRFDKTLVEPVCQASFLRYPIKDNDLLLFSNPASKTTRHRLTVRLSNDAGRTWPNAMLLHEGPSAYSCLTVLPDGSIGCLYEGGKNNAYEKIIFARFPLALLNTTNPEARDKVDRVNP